MAEKVKYGDLSVPRYGYGISDGLNYRQSSSRAYRKSGVSTWEDRGLEGIPMPWRNRAVRHYIDAFILGAANEIPELELTDNGGSRRTETWPVREDIGYVLYGSGLPDEGKGWNGKGRETKGIEVLFTVKGLNTVEETEAADKAYADRQEEIRREESDASEKLEIGIRERLESLDDRYGSDAAEAEKKRDERADEYRKALTGAKTEYDAAVKEISGKDLTEDYGAADRDRELDEALLEYEARRYGIETGYATHEDGSRKDGKSARLKQEMVAERLGLRREYVDGAARLSSKAESDMKAAKAARCDALRKTAIVQLERQKEILKEECDGLFLGMGCLEAMGRRRRIYTEGLSLAPMSSWLSTVASGDLAFPVSRQWTCADEVMARYADLEATRVLREDNDRLLNMDDRIHGTDEAARVTVTEKGQRRDDDGNLVDYADTVEAKWEVQTLWYSRSEWTGKDDDGEDREMYLEKDERPTEGRLVLYVGNVATSYGNARRIRRIVGDVLIETTVTQRGAKGDDGNSVTVRHARVEFAFDRMSKDAQTMSECQDKVVAARKAMYEDARDRYESVAAKEGRLIEGMKEVDDELDGIESRLADRVSERKREVDGERKARIDALVTECNEAIRGGADRYDAMVALTKGVAAVNAEMDESIREANDECSAELSEARKDASERRKELSGEAESVRKKAQEEHQKARREIEKTLTEELSAARAGFKDAWSLIGWERWTADVKDMMADAMVRPAVIRDTELKSGSVSVDVRLYGPYNLTAEVDWPYLTGGDFGEYIKIAEEEYIRKTTGSADGDGG